MVLLRCRWALLVGCGVVLAAGPVCAAKLTIKGTATQSLTASDNYFLTVHPSGPTFQSTSGLAIDAVALTPLTKYTFDGNVNYFTYFGSGAADTSLKTGLPLGASFAVDHSIDPLTKSNTLISWQRADLASQLLQQTGQAQSVRGYSDTGLAQAGLTRQFGPLDFLSWSAAASTTTFTQSTQTPYRDLSTTGTWKRALSPTLSVTPGLYVDYFASDDLTGSRRLYWKLTSQVDWQLSRRLSVTGLAGAILVNAWTTVAGSPSPTGILLAGGAHTGSIWSLSSNYLWTPTLKATASISKMIAPTVLGDLQQTTSIQGALTRDINHESNMTLSSQFAEVDTGAGTYNLLSAAIAYNYSLTREYRASVSYTYTQRNDQTGVARANIFNLTLTRDFTVLP